MSEYDERTLFQVFVRDTNFFTDKAGTGFTGNVEIVLGSPDGLTSGPQVKVRLTVPVTGATTLADATALLVQRAKQVVDRIAQETVETLIAEEQKSHDDKWPKMDSWGRPEVEGD